MADTKISGLPAVTVPDAADEFAVNQSATSKKVTLALLEEFLKDKGSNVASAGTVVLGDGLLFHITGTTTITDIDFTRSWDGRAAMLIFDASLLLTYNATTLVLPGKVSIQTSPGDSCWIVVDSGDNIKVVSYERADATEDNDPFNQFAGQAPGAGATTYLTGSNLAVPPSGLRLRSIFRWRFTANKGAAGTAASSIQIKVGTAGTTADATIITFTLPAGTAVADDAWFEIWWYVTGPLGATANSVGTMFVQHRLGQLSATELAGFIVQRHAMQRNNGSTFNSATAGLIVGLALTAGASQAWTIDQMWAEARNL